MFASEPDEQITVIADDVPDRSKKRDSVSSYRSTRQNPLMKKAKKLLARLLKNHRNILKDSRKVCEPMNACEHGARL